MCPDPEADLCVDTIPATSVATVCLDVRGDLDGFTAQRLVAAMAQALATTAAGVELHLAGVTFVGVAGIRCLLACQQAADAAGVPLVLRDPAPLVIRAVTTLGLTTRFAFVDTTPPPAEPARPEQEDDPDGLLQRSAQVRREARQLQARAREAVNRSRALRRP